MKVSVAQYQVLTTTLFESNLAASRMFNERTHFLYRFLFPSCGYPSSVAASVGGSVDVFGDVHVSLKTSV